MAGGPGADAAGLRGAGAARPAPSTGSPQAGSERSEKGKGAVRLSGPARGSRDLLDSGQREPRARTGGGCEAAAPPPDGPFAGNVPESKLLWLEFVRLRVCPMLLYTEGTR